MAAIPLHLLHERTEHGIEMHYYNPGDEDNDKDTLGIHRDDHYIFFLVEAGHARLMIDFQTVYFRPGGLYFILPGQVHHRITNEMAGGWFLAVDAGLLTAEQRQVFEERLTLQLPIQLANEEQARYGQVLRSLYQHYQNNTGQPFYRQVLYSLLQAFAGMVAAQYQSAEAQCVLPNRKTQLTRAFRSLLVNNLKAEKSPAAYAGLLNVSPAYLNEAVKVTTGMPVSYWIMQEVMLEARRLLYYTALDVKSVAHELGYDDHTYFFRLFKQQIGTTPLAFRRQYRE